MRRHFDSIGGFMLIAAAAAVIGCTDDARPNEAGTAGNGGGTGGSTGGTSGGVGGSGGSAGSAGSAGSTAGSQAGSGGAAGGAGGSGGAAGSGGSAGAGGGTGGTGGGGAGGTVGTGGTGGGGTGGAGGTAGGAGTSAGGTSGSGGSSGGAGTLAAPAISGAAVINSDFQSTSISLLNTQAGLVRADCVHSMTTGTGSKTISGDVVLPSQPQRGGQIVLIDRGNTALTFLNPGTCAVDRQFSVKAGFNMANPHDVVIVSDSKAYVTRYAKNAAPANPSAAGDDLLIMDPRNGTIAGRVDLSAYGSASFPASPDRAIIAAGKVVVSLSRWNATNYTYDKASLVIVNPDTDTVLQQVALGDLKNCEGLDYFDATKTVLVACAGSFGATEQALESGIAVVDVGVTPARVSRIISAVAFPTPPVTFLWVFALPSATSPTRAFTSTLGSFSPAVPDYLYQFDFVTGATMSFASGSPFDLGRPVGANGRLLVPDGNAATPRIHVFDTSGAGAPVKLSSFAADTVNGLPPREIGWY